MSEPHWKHSLALVKTKGRWKGSCSCGWQSEKEVETQPILDAYQAHTKLIEKEGRP